MGYGAIASFNRKQEQNTRSSTEAEFVAADDIAGPMIWTANFLKEQGYDFNSTLLQDTQSAIKLETNGQEIVGKFSCQLSIRYLFINDLKEKGHITVEYCPTDKILADYMSKPLHGKKFSEQWDAILNLSPAAAAQLIMISHFQVGPTKKRRNILKHSDAYIWERHYQSGLYYKNFHN